MSIVITVLDPRELLVADTLVTGILNKSVLSEITRKTIIVLGTKAKFVVGWVGLAIDATGQHETGR